MLPEKIKEQFRESNPIILLLPHVDTPRHVLERVDREAEFVATLKDKHVIVWYQFTPEASHQPPAVYKFEDTSELHGDQDDLAERLMAFWEVDTLDNTVVYDNRNYELEGES